MSTSNSSPSSPQSQRLRSGPLRLQTHIRNAQGLGGHRDEDGAGTAVVLSLPAEEVDGHLEGEDVGTLLVLVVNDERGIRDLLSDILGNAGFEVVQAEGSTADLKEPGESAPTW